MSNNAKKPCAETAAVLPEHGGGLPLQVGFPLPESIVFNEIFPRVPLESLCSLACVCRTLRSLVSQALYVLPSLDLSAFSPNGEILGHMLRRLRGLESVTIDCLRLDDSYVKSFFELPIQELSLLKGALLTYGSISYIGERCPELRALSLELALESPMFPEGFIEMLRRLIYLERLSIKVRITDDTDALYLRFFLPTTLKYLKLQPVDHLDALQYMERMIERTDITKSSYSVGGFALLNLSLVLDVITDRLLDVITRSFPLLVELDLEDRPLAEPILPNDLTNNGLQCLGSCHSLTSLSIVRSRVKCNVSFRRINDLGVLLLSESSKGLETVRLGGFSTVTDAGFSSLLRTCNNLRKFEVRNAPLLSDLAFHDVDGAGCPLVELKLVSCNLITSEAVASFSSSNTLEILDTSGCRSIANRCLDFVSSLRTLTSLNLWGADITDSGLTALSKGDLPLISLRLRGCTRVTDKGIISLINNGHKIKKTLSTLDVGHMPGISDKAIHAIISNAESISELCMRNCFHITGAPFGRCDGINLLRKLDIFHCIRFSVEMIGFLQTNMFCGLRWLGIGSTPLAYKRDDFSVIHQMRPWLTVCLHGCEVGCHDGWQFHRAWRNN